MVADEFVNVPIMTDEATMADNAIQRLVDSYDGWQPNEGDLEVILVEALAQMAADAAQVAAVMPAAAFHTILRELFAIPIDEGQYATSSVTFTLLDTDPHTIPVGTEIDVDGYAFTVDSDTATAALTVAGVPVTAAEPGTAFNALVGDQVAMLSALAFVDSVALDTPPAGGTDPEQESDFLSRGSQELELLAKTLVTGRDYELVALTSPSAAHVVVIANQATRTITVIPSTSAGGPMPAPEKTALLALYNEYRQTTWTVAIADPTLTTINVTFSIHAYPTFVASAVVDEAEALVTSFLDPSTWGVPPGSAAPVVESRVRKNKLIDLIGDAPGVDYVVAVTITGSGGSTDAPTGDWIMPGTVPLPHAGTIAGSSV
jgi:hypothetical protein